MISQKVAEGIAAEAAAEMGIEAPFEILVARDFPPEVAAYMGDDYAATQVWEAQAPRAKHATFGGFVIAIHEDIPPEQLRRTIVRQLLVIHSYWERRANDEVHAHLDELDRTIQDFLGQMQREIYRIRAEHRRAIHRPSLDEKAPQPDEEEPDDGHAFRPLNDMEIAMMATEPGYDHAIAVRTCGECGEMHHEKGAA